MKAYTTIGLLPYLLLAGCNFLAFNDIEDEAPVRSFESDQADFGQQIAVYTDETEKQTWVAVSSEGISRYLTYQVHNDKGYTFPDGKDYCDGCDANLPGFDTAALAFAGVSDLTRGTEYCVVTPYNGKGPAGDETGLSVACDRPIQCGPNEIDRCTVRGEVSRSLGTGAAAVFGSDALGYAQMLLSDPMRAPYLFRLNNDSVASVSFTTGEPSDGFGANLISKPEGNQTRFAATNGSEVYLYDLGSTGANLVGCLDAGAEVKALAWINDGIAVGVNNEVRLHTLGEFATPCAGVATTGITCADLPDASYAGSVVCAGLGSAVGAADVDGDGSQELLLGAPQTEVGGSNGAGAVFVVPDAGTTPAQATVLVDPDPKIGQRLGASVQGVPVYPAAGPREEVAAGAPGARGWRLFLCSGQPGDDSNPGSRCVP